MIRRFIERIRAFFARLFGRVERPGYFVKGSAIATFGQVAVAPFLPPSRGGGGGGGGGSTIVEDNPPTGARPGTVFAISQPVTVLLVRHNSLWLQRVAVFSGAANEFTLVGTVLTTSDTIDVADDFYAVGWT